MTQRIGLLTTGDAHGVNNIIVIIAATAAVIDLVAIADHTIPWYTHCCYIKDITIASLDIRSCPQYCGQLNLLLL